MNDDDVRIFSDPQEYASALKEYQTVCKDAKALLQKSQIFSEYIEPKLHEVLVDIEGDATRVEEDLSVSPSERDGLKQRAIGARQFLQRFIQKIHEEANRQVPVKGF